jgi:hypothetical protein
MGEFGYANSIFKPMKMPHYFPGTPQDWLRGISFPFQAFVVLAIFVEQFFERQLPHNYQGGMSDARNYVSLGYLVWPKSQFLEAVLVAVPCGSNFYSSNSYFPSSSLVNAVLI